MNSSIGYWMENDAITTAYSRVGLVRLLNWQCQCLITAIGENKQDEGTNLLYTAPTSGGKTLVAEILMVRRLMSQGRRRKIVFILPYNALIAEKVNMYSNLLSKMQDKIRVKGFFEKEYMNDTKARDIDILLCTVEKADSYINELILKE